MRSISPKGGGGGTNMRRNPPAVKTINHTGMQGQGQVTPKMRCTMGGGTTGSQTIKGAMGRG